MSNCCRKIFSVVDSNTGTATHLLLSRRWNYFDHCHDYFFVRLTVTGGRMHREEYKIPRAVVEAIAGELAV